jgi:hypothetical protein
MRRSDRSWPSYGATVKKRPPGAKRLDYCGGDRLAGIDRPTMILIESDLAWSLAIDNPSLPQVGRCIELPHRGRKRPKGRTDVRLELRSDG